MNIITCEREEATYWRPKMIGFKLWGAWLPITEKFKPKNEFYDYQYGKENNEDL